MQEHPQASKPAKQTRCIDGLPPFSYRVEGYSIPVRQEGRQSLYEVGTREGEAMIYKRNNYWHLDVTINGVRYREALHTADRREAAMLEKKRIGEIQAGKAASKTARDFARRPFPEAVAQFLGERKPHISERTHELEQYLSNSLRRFFGERPLLRIRAEDIAQYQKQRRAADISGRTLNLEIGFLRRLMKRAKVWNTVAEDVRLDREATRPIAKVLTPEQKRLLFETAGSRPGWWTAYCAAVLAVNTTCRGIELKHLRWQDIDLFDRTIAIRRSKTEAGHRVIPMNRDAAAILARLLERARTLGHSSPDHFVFPSCERLRIDPARPQKTWRTAWRSLVKATAKRAGDLAAQSALYGGANPDEARTRAEAPFARLRFHDLRHQAITELAEAGAPDATMMALAGHVSREMLEHYSHVRMAAKREALDRLSTGLIHSEPDESATMARPN